MMFPPLATARLDLVRIVPEHAEAFFEIYSDPAVMRLYPKEPCPSVAACGAVVEAMRAIETRGEGYRWALQRRTDGAVVGAVGFHDWDRQAAWAAFSYELIPSARGQGLAAEAAREALAFGFGPMRLRQVIAEIHAENEPSLRLAQALGFEPAGHYRRFWKNEALPFRVFKLRASA